MTAPRRFREIPAVPKYGDPVVSIQRLGRRWQVWVTHGPLRIQGEFGTYALTRKGAERKAQRLLGHCDPSR